MASIFSTRRAQLILLSLALVMMPVKAPLSADSERAGDDAILRMLRDLSQQVGALRTEVQALRSELRRASKSDPASPQGRGNVSIELRDGDYTQGLSTARVTVVEFSDFQCPYCYRFFNQTYPGLKRDYVDTGKVKYVFRNFPLEFHRQARPAALAAECAGSQGKFWEMHDGLFANQKRLGPELYVSLAEELQLDTQIFKTCLASSIKRQSLEVETSLAEELGVRGTPTFFVGKLKDGHVVNATRIAGAQPLSNFARVIDAMLQ